MNARPVPTVPTTELFPDSRNDADELYHDTLEHYTIECSLRTVRQTLAARSLQHLRLAPTKFRPLTVFGCLTVHLRGNQCPTLRVSALFRLPFRGPGHISLAVSLLRTLTLRSRCTRADFWGATGVSGTGQRLSDQ